jgi:hypothetical protein
MKICYRDQKFRPASLKLIAQANEIVVEYLAQGLDLTLRQLYYQFVARDIIENNQKSYKRLGAMINNARLAGMIDWEAIEDRTRRLEGVIHEGSPESAVASMADDYQIDKWTNQPYRVEVWVEKEALIGVFEGICRDLDVDYFACRGNVSQSEMWRAAMRLDDYRRKGQRPVVLHFGDHDPSGLDMTRDNDDRFQMFGAGVDVRRIALNMDQVEQYNPPPNFAKQTDSRYRTYAAEFGDQSWELDALDPTVLRDLVRDNVFELRDPDLWGEMYEKEQRERRQLREVSDQWSDIVEGFCG